jgi:hypothetical protein
MAGNRAALARRVVAFLSFCPNIRHRASDTDPIFFSDHLIDLDQSSPSFQLSRILFPQGAPPPVNGLDCFTEWVSLDIRGEEFDPSKGPTGCRRAAQPRHRDASRRRSGIHPLLPIADRILMDRSRPDYGPSCVVRKSAVVGGFPTFAETRSGDMVAPLPAVCLLWVE